MGQGERVVTIWQTFGLQLLRLWLTMQIHSNVKITRQGHR